MLAADNASISIFVAEKSAREACPYWNAIGVLDDHMELMCGDGQVSESALEHFNPLLPESLAMACCPIPYKACALAERVTGCDALLAPLFKVEKGKTSPDLAYSLVQKVRGALRNADEKCHVLPAEEPHAKCGGSPTGAAFSRADIFCEMMLWQSEQIGDGNEDEYKRNGCPWGGRLVEKPERHRGALKQADLPTMMSTMPSSMKVNLFEHKKTLTRVQMQRIKRGRESKSDFF